MSLPWVAQSALAFGGFILVAVSLFVSWWTLRFSYPTSGVTESGTIHFLPGASAQAIINGASGSLSYAAIGESVASLYGMVQVAAICIAVAAALTAVLSAIAGTSIKSRPWASVMGAGFNVAAVIGLALLVGLFPIAVPQSLPNAPATIYGGCAGSGSPCSSFYGSFNGNGSSQSWGPDVGWYLAIAALALLAIAIASWFASTHRSSIVETAIVAS